MPSALYQGRCGSAAIAEADGEPACKNERGWGGRGGGGGGAVAASKLDLPPAGDMEGREAGLQGGCHVVQVRVALPIREIVYRGQVLQNIPESHLNQAPSSVAIEALQPLLDASHCQHFQHTC